MPDPTSPVAPERPAEPLVYRPVSGLAIAGLAFAGLYTVLALVSVMIAFLKREPFFLPGWTLVLAGAGGILSFLAMWQIRTSEGTRAGLTLARWGLWLCVLCGLGSVTYALFTGIAIRQQANRFLLDKGPDAGFFPLLQAKDVNAAFLLTQPPGARRQANPNNDRDMAKYFDLPLEEKTPKGRLSFFRQADLVRMLQQPYDPPAKVTAGTVRTWAYEAKGYQIERDYHVTTPEGEFKVPLKVQSVESETPGEGRKWMILWGPGTGALEPVRLTAKGKQMLALRYSAAAFADAWLANLAGGNLSYVYLNMRPPAERWRRVSMHLARLHLLAPAASLAAAPGSPGWAVLLGQTEGAHLGPALRAGAQDPARTFVVDKHLQIAGAEAAVRPGLQRILSQLGRTNQQLFGMAPRIDPKDAKTGFWLRKDGQLEIALPVEFAVSLPAAAPDERVQLSGKVVVAAKDNADADAQPGDLLWRVVRLEFDRALPVRPMARPGPNPGRPGPP